MCLLKATAEHDSPCRTKGTILLANLFQGSRSPFACLRFSNLFAFKEGMWGTQISVLLGSPTVSGTLRIRN